MTLSSFCGILTLQVGVAVLAAVFFTLAGVILAANIFSYETIYDGWPLSLIFMILFVIGLIIAGLLMFVSSYAENRSLAMAAMMVIIILFFYWVVLCCFSFVSAPNHVRTVCVYLHCPESFWIASLAYRAMHHKYNSTDPDENEFKKEKRSIDKTTYSETNQSGDVSSFQNLDKMILKRSNIDADLQFNNDKPHIANKGLLHNIQNQIFIQATETTTKDPPIEEPEDESRYYVGLPLFGAVLLFFINFLFLIFSICVMWSWASELNWTDYYIEDEPVVVYEDNY